MAPARDKTRLLLALIGLLTLALYAPSVGNGFAMDDRLVVRPMLDEGRPNELVHHLRPVAEYFRSNYHQGSGHVSPLYRPVTVLSYALVNELQRRHADPDLAAASQHLINVLLHLAATLLVFALVRRAGGSRAGALAGALVFGVHVLHSEAVANVVGRAELLAFCAGAGGALLVERALTLRAGSAAAAWLAALVLLFAAFCSKESALAWAAFAPVLVLARRWQRGGSAGSERLPRAGIAVGVVVLALPLAAFALLRADMLAGLSRPPPLPEYVANPLAHVDAGTRIGTGVMLWGFGLLKTMLPLPPVADYGPVATALVDGPGDLRPWLAAAALLLCLGWGLALGRRHPLLLLAAAAFFGFAFATSNIPLPIGTIFGERLYYAPSLGLSFVVAWLVQAGAGRRLAFRALLLLWVVASSALVLERNPTWRDDATLFVHEAGRNPPSVRMLVCAAGVDLERGDLASAERRLRRAVELLPEYALAWNNLGAVLLDQQRFEEAEAALRRAMRARHRIPGSHRAMLHANLGTVLERLGRPDEARRELERALRLAPGDPVLRRKLGAR